MSDYALSKGIGNHHCGFKGRTDEWLTPPSILKALGTFDLDPCAPVDRPWDTAARHFTIEYDGLARPWEEFWCNKCGWIKPNILKSNYENLLPMRDRAGKGPGMTIQLCIPTPHRPVRAFVIRYENTPQDAYAAIAACYHAHSILRLLTMDQVEVLSGEIRRRMGNELVKRKLFDAGEKVRSFAHTVQREASA